MGFLVNFRDFCEGFQRFYPVKHRDFTLLGHVNLKGQKQNFEVNQPANTWKKFGWWRWIDQEGLSSGVIKRGWEIPELNGGLTFKAGTRWEHHLEMR